MLGEHCCSLFMEAAHTAAPLMDFLILCPGEAEDIFFQKEVDVDTF